MSIKNELKHIWNLPFVPGYLYGDFFISKYPEEDVIRYGVIFVDEHRPHFLLLCEVFNKISDLSKHKSEKIAEEKVYFGYIPNFPLVRDILRGKKENFEIASWIKENEIFTVVPIGKHESVKPYLKEVLDSNTRLIKQDLFPLFEKHKYIPDSINEWNLVTMFFWFSNLRDERGINHRIMHVQGNYKKSTNFLNVELRFGCPCPECLPGLRVNFKNEEEIVINQKKVKKGFNLNEEMFMNYVDDEKKFSIICHDNGTNTSRDEKSLKLLMSKSIDLTNYYYPEFLFQQFMRNLV